MPEPRARQTAPSRSLMMNTNHQLLLTLILLANASLARAAEVAFQDVTAVPYSQFVTLHHSDAQPTGAVEKYVAPAGSNLWLITFRMVPTWDEATERMDFDSQTFGFYLGD